MGAAETESAQARTARVEASVEVMLWGTVVREVVVDMNTPTCPSLLSISRLSRRQAMSDEAALVDRLHVSLLVPCASSRMCDMTKTYQGHTYRHARCNTKCQDEQLCVPMFGPYDVNSLRADRADNLRQRTPLISVLRELSIRSRLAP
jgi:hypothetical protein